MPFDGEKPSPTQFLQRCIEPDCNAEYKIDEPLYVCRKCGGLLDIESDRSFGSSTTLKGVWNQRRMSPEPRDRSGVWRFREFLPFDDKSTPVSLQEGNTPLYDGPRAASYCNIDSLKLKHQGCNPTGSFKDTGMTVAITQAVNLDAKLVACASTGNTAASLAAYAARAGLPCAIMVPAGQVSMAKLAQSLDYGAAVLEVEGNFDACMSIIREVSEDLPVYLVNSINPFRIEGQKTVAFELMEQLEWNVPDHIVLPGGNLGNSSALGKGFRELQAAGFIDRQPRISVIQAKGAAPFARWYNEHLLHPDVASKLEPEQHPYTLASAINIGAPVSWQKAWRAVSETGGVVLTVEEQEIADAKATIGRDGIGCEPASATTVAGIRNLVQQGFIRGSDKVVAVLTGHLLKDTDYAVKYYAGSLASQGILDNVSNRPIKVSGAYDQISAAFSRLIDERKSEAEPLEVQS
jgi:threonine synthase